MFAYREKVIEESSMTNLSSISQSIEYAMKNPTLPSLEQIQTDMQPHVADVSEVLRRYSDLVDKFFEANPPLVSKDDTQDLTDFIQLIGFSTILGSYFLIEKWCVQRLQKDKLAQPLTYYISKMQALDQNPKTFGLELEVKPYVQYLVDRLNGK
jgi:hypothetical protein